MKRNFVPLGEVAEITGGYAFKSSLMSSEPKEFQIIKMSNLYQGSLDLSRNPSFWEKVDTKTEHYLLQTDDILMTLTGTVGKRDYGYTVQLRGEEKLLLNQRVCRIRPMHKKVNGFYLLQYLRTQEFLNKFFDCSIGGTGNQSNVGILDLRELDISLPPLPYQKAIADLLATWDETIEITECLITLKKRHFKQLLADLISMPRDTSKNTKWQKVILGDICKVITSNVDKKTSPNEAPVCLCNYMDVYKNYYITSELCFMKATASPSEIEKFQLKKYDVLLTKDSETPDDIANSACVLDAHENLLCGYHLAILRPKKHVFGPYLNFALHTPKIRYQFSSQANGATRFGLTMSAYNMVELPLPSFEEQKVIAETLSAVQKELDLLKQLAEKYKTQKRGLMQKLLTGQWRVKPEIINGYKEQ